MAEGTYSATHSYHRFGGGGSGLDGCGSVGGDWRVCRGRCDGGGYSGDVRYIMVVECSWWWRCRCMQG